MRTLKEILHTSDGIGDKPMAVTDDSEIEMLVELIQGDWTIEGLGTMAEGDMQTVHGTVLLGLMKRYEIMKKALQSIVDDNEFCKASFRAYGDRGREYAKTALEALD